MSICFGTGQASNRSTRWAMLGILLIIILFANHAFGQDIEKHRVIQIQKALRKAGYHVSIDGILIGRTYALSEGRRS